MLKYNTAPEHGSLVRLPSERVRKFDITLYWSDLDLLDLPYPWRDFRQYPVYVVKKILEGPTTPGSTLHSPYQK